MYQPEQDFTGRYTLKAHLGTGGFGQVWKAYDHTIEEHVAIKIVGGGAQMSRDLVKACSSEYKATLKIHHPHLLTPSYFDIYQGQMYLVMPLCEGGSLAAYLHQGALAEKDVRRLFRELIAALAYLHASGLLHNDIKPDNILLSKPPVRGRQLFAHGLWHQHAPAHQRAQEHTRQQQRNERHDPCLLRPRAFWQLAEADPCHRYFFFWCDAV